MLRATCAGLLGMSLAASLATSVAAAEPSATLPDPSTTPLLPWPTGDQLRRELQAIDFVFRVDGSTGDWLGWAPPAEAGDPPALGLDGAGTRPAAATFDLQLIDADPSVLLSAYLEVAARLPIKSSDVDRARRFIVDDLLTAPPETLESCYTTDWERGAVLVNVDIEAASALVRLAYDADAAYAGDSPEADGAPDLADCAPLIPAEIAAELGDPSSERVTISLTGDPVAFEPAEVTLSGALVTVVLTFHNQSAIDQTLEFEAPLVATTGPVEPGGTKLIVVRRLQPGEYPFFSDADPDGVRGVLQIESPSLDE